MTEKTFLLFIATLLFFTSCSDTQERGYITESGATPIALNSSYPHSSLADSMVIEDIVELETNEKSTISKDYAIKRIVTDLKKTYILDNKFMSVKVFDEKGKFLYELGSLGNGKAEFTNIQDISVDPETHNIWLLCNTPKKIIEFSSSGKLLRERELSFFASALGFGTDKNIYFFNNQNPNSVSRGKNLIITNNDLRINGAIFNLPKKLNSSFDFVGNIFSCENEIFYNPPYDKIIYELKDGNAKSAYKVDFGDLSTPNDFPGDSLNYYTFNKANISNFFVKKNGFVGVRYFEKGSPMNAFYNERTKNVLITDIAMNVLNKLFKNAIFQTETSFVMILNYAHLGAVIKENKVEVQRYFPLLYEHMLTYKSHNNPSLLYFKIK